MRVSQPVVIIFQFGTGWFSEAMIVELAAGKKWKVHDLIPKGLLASICYTVTPRGPMIHQQEATQKTEVAQDIRDIRLDRLGDYFFSVPATSFRGGWVYHVRQYSVVLKQADTFFGGFQGPTRRQSCLDREATKLGIIYPPEV